MAREIIDWRFFVDVPLLSSFQKQVGILYLSQMSSRLSAYDFLLGAAN